MHSLAPLQDLIPTLTCKIISKTSCSQIYCRDLSISDYLVVRDRSISDYLVVKVLENVFLSSMYVHTYIHSIQHLASICLQQLASACGQCTYIVASIFILYFTLLMIILFN